MVLVIGLAGTIAAGKSTVGDMLEARGAVHCDADKLVHRLYDPGTPGFDRVVEAFGRDIVGEDGFIDRKILGAKVFGKPLEMARLTKAIGSITDAVHAEIDKWRETLGPDDIAVMEAVNLMEAGYARWCDQMWLVGVDDAVAVKRLLETRGMSEEEANQRLRSMRPFEQRAPGADWTYMNNGTREELEAAANVELDRIVALKKAGKLKRSVFGPWWADHLEAGKEALIKSGVKLPTDEEIAELRRRD
ncbi:MAG: dephospho-CoA kinase [Dehalococcoidia bacterium]|nr:dephospho-CoA kinase [Dehalococcoidia bacterium]